MLLPFDMIGRICCTRKNGARTLTANSLSKSSTVVSSMVAVFETPALATRMSRRSPTMLRACLASLPAPFRGGEVRRYGIRAATGFAYLRDNAVGFMRAAAVVHQNLGTGRGERECAGAAHAARSAGHERGLTGQSRHDHRPRCCCAG